MEPINHLMLEAKKINKKIAVKAMLIFVLIALGILALIVTIHNTVLTVFCFFALIITITAEAAYIISQKRKILLYDMNPRLYYAVLHENKNQYNGREEDIGIFYFSGDYQNVITCTNALIAEKESKNKKFNNVNVLNNLCCSYFEMGDYENAKRTIDYIKSLFADTKVNPKSVYSTVILPQLDFMESFINCDFSKCLEVENLLNAKLKKSNTFIARIKYYTALAKYYYGDITSAQNDFKEILAFCPNLNYANLASQYLSAMENGEILTLNQLDTNFKYKNTIHMSGNARVKKIKTKQIIWFVIWALLLALNLYFIVRY